MLFSSKTSLPPTATSKEFPLDAYHIPEPDLNNPAVTYLKPSDRTPYPTDLSSTISNEIAPFLNSLRRIRFLLMLILSSWLWMLLASDIARIACFTIDLPPAITPPSFVCNRLTPSTHQLLQSATIHPNFFAATLDIRAIWLQQHLWTLQGSRNLFRNFALRGAGASVIRDLTSPSLQGPGIHQADLVLNLPTIVLEDQLNVGDCWEFAGSAGRIGILLSEETNITAMTINYINPNTVSSKIWKKAPRSVRLWALDTQRAESRHPSKDVRNMEDFSTTRRIPAGYVKDDKFMPILHGHFDIYGPSQRQIFLLDRALWDFSSYPTQLVILEVESNWGGGSTCLHQVAIHGLPAELTT